MGGIFISYRRQDSGGHTGRLRDHLRARFGNLVFQDVDGIADGEVFETVLSKALESCEVALVVMGRDWLGATDARGQRRLDDPEDWVRVETRQLLERNIRVIPVLVGGAAMPQAKDLPADMQALAKRQARELRDTAWEADVAALVQRLSEILRVDGRGSAAPAAASKRRLLLGGLAAAAAVAVAAGAWLALRQPAVEGVDSVDGNAGAAGVPGNGAPESHREPVDEKGIRDAVHPAIEAAGMIGLLGTWRMDDFSGFERPEGAPTTYEMKVMDDRVRLVPFGASDPSDVMTVKQITGRAVTLTRADVAGKPFDFMYVFNLSADSKTLDDCATVRVSNFENLGPCRWRYKRVPQGAGTPARTRPEASCSVDSAADPGCIDAARTVGLLGTWRAGADGHRYRFRVEGDAVRLAADDADGVARFAVRSIEGDTLTLGWTPFEDVSDFDPQQAHEYDMTIDGARLVNCRSLMTLSTRTEQSQCTDVPPFLVRESD